MANLTDWGESIKVPDSLLEKVDLCVKCGRHESRTSLVIEAIELWLENDELFNGAVNVKEEMTHEIPICARCGHKATMHVVDGEERRECMEWGCDCEQFEIDLIPCGPKPEEMDDNAGQ